MTTDDMLSGYVAGNLTFPRSAWKELLPSNIDLYRYASQPEEGQHPGTDQCWLKLVTMVTYNHPSEAVSDLIVQL